MAKNKMSKQDASRIQTNADRSGTNQGFKSRAQSSADSNEMYFTKEEALDILKINEDSFNDHVKQGHVKSKTFTSGELKYLKEDVKHLLHFILDD